MNIVLLGPLPPPHGGVSVHLNRLTAGLQNVANSVKVESEQGKVESFLSFTWRVLRASRRGILHSHVHNPWTLWLLGWRHALLGPTLVTVHNERVPSWVASLSVWKRVVVLSGLRRVGHFVAVSEAVRKGLLALGVPDDRITVLAAFLPPSRLVWESEVLPEPVVAFSATHSPLVSMNAYHLSNLDGIPLYGADMGVELLRGLRTTLPDAGLVLYVATDPSGTEVDALRSRIADAGLGDHFLVISGSKPFGPLLVRANAYVRPTSTDGDSVSVREALCLGIPVVASDVCIRPPGTHVFEARNSDALLQMTLVALANPVSSGQETLDGSESIPIHRTLYGRLLTKEDPCG